MHRRCRRRPAVVGPPRPHVAPGSAAAVHAGELRGAQRGLGHTSRARWPPSARRGVRRPRYDILGWRGPQAEALGRADVRPLEHHLPPRVPRPHRLDPMLGIVAQPALHRHGLRGWQLSRLAERRPRRRAPVPRGVARPGRSSGRQAPGDLGACRGPGPQTTPQRASSGHGALARQRGAVGARGSRLRDPHAEWPRGVGLRLRVAGGRRDQHRHGHLVFLGPERPDVQARLVHVGLTRVLHAPREKKKKKKKY
mmetsp:Transcript_27197/g.54976  ORF Transcript_27197/g.54976 Transcript_27197/m.54976 type:complete len:253 (-) Transcript_27197:14-772(-)